MTQLTSDQLAIRDMTRSFVRREVAPFATEWDRAAAVNPATVRKAGELGLFGVAIPGEWGGAGADMISYVLAMEELAYGDAGFCNLVTATNSFALKVLAAGTPDQKRRFLAPVARGEQVDCRQVPMRLTSPPGLCSAAIATSSTARSRS
jgi:butyryl-CoA dehydrogenase